MAIWMAIILGLIQGVTEFLPVSSSGHLMLGQKFLGLENDLLLFDIFLHIATLCAVLIVFRKKIWELIQKPFCKTNYCLVIGTVITCAIVLVFKDWIDSTMTYKVLPITFLITAIVLFAVTMLPKQKDVGEGEIKYKTGIVAGIAQGIAVIPGISRSGSTIAASLATGVKREEAAEFAFLMSIPIIIASFLYEVVSNGSASLSAPPLALIGGFVAAFVSGIFAIKFMLKLVKHVKLYWFSIYLTVLSVVLMFVFYL